MNLEDILNFAIPTLLLLIALGFVYVKFLSPWVIPMLSRLWEWAKGTTANRTEGEFRRREISYGD